MRNNFLSGFRGGLCRVMRRMSVSGAYHGTYFCKTDALNFTMKFEGIDPTRKRQGLGV